MLPSSVTSKELFSPPHKGELIELRNDLRSNNVRRRTVALQRLVAMMTIGCNVAELLTDVLQCLQTDKLELRKLVYLFLISNAHKMPEQATLAVNSLTLDCRDPRPLIRALAVRTLSYLRVPDLTEHLADSLRLCLADEDPYVRKCAAMGVAKLHAVDPSLVTSLGLIDMLRDMLGDSNPAVVTNALVALLDVGVEQIPALSTASVNRFLAALSESNEWAQIYILEAISRYQSSTLWESRAICDRVTPYLIHVNSAVVMSAIKVILSQLENLPADDPIIANLSGKISGAVSGLLMTEYELQYVVLRNIRILMETHQHLVKYDVRNFFVKYNDPIYIKVEKLDILVRMTSAENFPMILAELMEYVREVDVEFVKKAVRAIGRCAIKIQSSADHCVNALLDLIGSNVSYVVDEVITVFRDIFRRYPNCYENSMNKLFELDHEFIDDEAKSAFIWMMGEFCERIDESETILETYLENFPEEPLQIQLSLLTAAVKALLKKPTEASSLAQRVLQLAVDSPCPDLRDRGYVYWRLLSSDPEAARAVVLVEKPPIVPVVDSLDTSLAKLLANDFGSLAAVLHQMPSTFLDLPASA